MAKEKKNVKKETETTVTRYKKNSTTTKYKKTVTETVRNESAKNKKRYKVKEPLTEEQRAKRTRKVVIIVLSAILCVALILGIVLGIVTLVRIRLTL